MKKAFYILVVLALVLILGKTIQYFVKMAQEKKIFGGRTRQQFIKLMTEAWKEKYFEAMKQWISFSNQDPGAQSWAAAIRSKAEENNTTFEKQRLYTINYLWDNNMGDQLYVPGRTKWNNAWAKDYAKSIGADSENPKVIETLTVIQKK